MDMEDKLKQSTNVSKDSWKIINGNRKKNEDLKCMLREGASLIEDGHEICSVFNAHFLSVAGQLKTDTLPFGEPLNCVSYSDRSIFLTPTTPKEVESVILTLKNTNTTGYDHVSSRVLRHCAQYISFPLADAINASFEEGVFPSRLKYTVVRPLHKGGNSDDKNNYRPIALTSVFSKVFEKLFLLRIEPHCAAFLSNNQFGFVKGKTCLDAATHFLSQLVDAIDHKEHAVGLLIDLQKAFDCVLHDLLLSRAETFGIRGMSNNWLRSFLNMRYQKVVMKGYSSEYQLMNTGVPQGSILGPFLFNIYINNVANCISNGNITLYADDIALAFKGTTIEDIEVDSSSSVCSLMSFLSHSGLSISTKKSNIILFGTSRGRSEESPQLYLNDECPVAESDTYKYLGLHIDAHFNWDFHIDSVCKKVSSGLFVLRSFASYRSDQLHRLVYFSLIEAHLRYCIALWGSANGSSLVRLLKLQKRAVRIMAGLKRLDSCRNAFRHLGLLTLTGLYLLEVITYARFHSATPDGANFHHYHTRSAVQLRSAQVRLNMAKSLPQNAGALMFNKLPATLTSIKTEREFRFALKTHLITKSYYSVGEFEADLR